MPARVCPRHPGGRELAAAVQAGRAARKGHALGDRGWMSTPIRRARAGGSGLLAGRPERRDFGAADAIGHRPTMEDAHVVRLRFRGSAETATFLFRFVWRALQVSLLVCRCCPGSSVARKPTHLWPCSMATAAQRWQTGWRGISTGVRAE